MSTLLILRHKQEDDAGLDVWGKGVNYLVRASSPANAFDQRLSAATKFATICVGTTCVGVAVYSNNYPFALLVFLQFPNPTFSVRQTASALLLLLCSRTIVHSSITALLS